MKRMLVNFGLKSKMTYQKLFGFNKHVLWDGLVFSKTKEAFGGKVRMMCVGSAPISQETVRFIRAVSSVPLVEGYGQTECVGAGFITDLNDNRLGRVGGPFPCIEFKL